MPEVLSDVAIWVTVNFPAPSPERRLDAVEKDLSSTFKEVVANLLRTEGALVPHGQVFHLTSSKYELNRELVIPDGVDVTYGTLESVAGHLKALLLEVHHLESVTVSVELRRNGVVQEHPFRSVA